MASRLMFGRFFVPKVSPRIHLSSTRSIVTARTTTSRSSTVRSTASKTLAARASTAVGTGNTDTLPSTADNVESPEASTSPTTASPSASNGSFPLDVGEQINGNELDNTATDWSKSYFGLSQQPFPKEAADVLLAPIDAMDVEIKPDGLIYLPEIKYRRVLNKAFGPGGWGLAPRGQTNVGPKIVSREYALVCLGRLVAIARGEQEYFDPNGVPTATEACKSNALMRCCKDLGIASELWDPRFIREFKLKYCVEVYAEHVPTKKKRKLWRRKDQPKFDYPYKE